MTHEQAVEKYRQIAVKNGDPVKTEKQIDNEVRSVYALAQIIIKAYKEGQKS